MITVRTKAKISVSPLHEIVYDIEIIGDTVKEVRKQLTETVKMLQNPETERNNDSV